MGIVQIEEISIASTEGSALLNRQIDLPRSGTSQSTYVIHIEGWLLTNGKKPKRLVMELGETRIRDVGSFIERPDVADYFGNVAGSVAAGFYADVDCVTFPENFVLTLRVVFDDASEAKIGTVRGRRSHPLPNHAPAIQPIAVYGSGRSGTTLLMRYLLNHPQVVAHNAYPYEIRMMSYQFHAMSIMKSRADHERSAHPDHFTDSEYSIGFNPYYSPGAYGETVARWFGGEYITELAKFCTRSIESFYKTLAAAQDKPGAEYFAEKVQPFAGRDLQWTLYPDSRALLIVRDPRDRHCSVSAFNKKRGQTGFGYERGLSEEQFVERTYNFFKFELAALARRPQQVKLVRYEDLILKPEETVSGILEHLRLDSRPACIRQVIAATGEADPRLQEHRTSEEGRSIGRWKSDLDPKIARYYAQCFGGVMAELGYEF